MDFNKGKPGREAEFPFLSASHLFVPNLDATCYVGSRLEGHALLEPVKELLQGWQPGADLYILSLSYRKT